ncbi:mitochondrial PGP phosphatase-domain-containing protein [Mycena albidolilacea]|uniref:Mitochondrial PGP phosphatase-domain-containing protein n=1 Tax=Mycena albidolilacea TaxID=1033008 RepID=A0AAD7A6N0_9AGAR|nr:mitochondrial PGP phosphatase-domain-containing protein [Mycena albidolilacea]
MPLNIPGLLVPFQLVFNPRIILPNLVVKDIRHLDFRALKEAGYCGAVFDKDNCLTLPHKDELVPELRDAWDECRQTFGEGNVLIVSNSAGCNSDTGGIQAESVKRRLQAPVLFHSTPKPGYACIKAIQRYFSSLRTPVRPEQLIIVGDRVFTDVVLANRLRNVERGSGLLHLCFRCGFERGGTIGTENDAASGHRSFENGPLAIWTTGVWKREATVMRWCEKKLVDIIQRRIPPDEIALASSRFIKEVAPQPARTRSWKFWRS